MNATESLRYFLPELFLLSGALISLGLDLFVRNKKLVGFFAVLVLLGTAVFPQVSDLAGKPLELFYGFFTLDAYTCFFRVLTVLILAATVLISISYRELSPSEEGEYYTLLLLTGFGLILMAASTNLLMIFLSVEFVSLMSYILTGFLRKSHKAKEAAMKYLLYGSAASGIMLFGMSLVFGASGSLELSIIRNLSATAPFYGVTLIALILFLVGLGFKISMAPFHMWAPDVYEAAPTPVAAFLTVAPKALGFALMMRVLSTGFLWINWKWSPLLMGLSILTMTVGNVTAIAQTNIKRLLAYSSIAQAGYILMGVCTFNETGVPGVLIYLVAYAFTNLGAFTVVIMVSNSTKSDELLSYAGLAKRAPFLAASLTVFMLSLAGIPPLAGFIGKFYVFSSAIQAGYLTLAVAAAVNSAIAAFYYFKVVRLMYLVPEETPEKIPYPLPLTLALGLLLIGTFAVGLAPSVFIKAVQTALFV